MLITSHFVTGDISQVTMKKSHNAANKLEMKQHGVLTLGPLGVPVGGTNDIHTQRISKICIR